MVILLKVRCSAGQQQGTSIIHIIRANISKKIIFKCIERRLPIQIRKLACSLMAFARANSVVWKWFLYTCANSFIYAYKFDPVRRILVGLILCKVCQPDGGSDIQIDEMARNWTAKLKVYAHYQRAVNTTLLHYPVFTRVQADTREHGPYVRMLCSRYPCWRWLIIIINGDDKCVSEVVC